MNLTVFHQQSKLHMEGFRSLREGEAVEFTFKKSSKGLESVWVTGPNGAPCLGNERRPKSAQKRRAKADRYVQSEDIRMLIWDLNTSTFWEVRLLTGSKINNNVMSVKFRPGVRW